MFSLQRRTTTSRKKSLKELLALLRVIGSTAATLGADGPERGVYAASPLGFTEDVLIEYEASARLAMGAA